MRLGKAGDSTSVAEVTNISGHGIWLYVGGKKYFLRNKEANCCGWHNS